MVSRRAGTRCRRSSRWWIGLTLYNGSVLAEGVPARNTGPGRAARRKRLTRGPAQGPGDEFVLLPRHFVRCCRRSSANWWYCSRHGTWLSITYNELLYIYANTLAPKPVPARPLDPGDNCGSSVCTSRSTYCWSMLATYLERRTAAAEKRSLRQQPLASHRRLRRVRSGDAPVRLALLDAGGSGATHPAAPLS